MTGSEGCSLLCSSVPVSKDGIVFFGTLSAERNAKTNVALEMGKYLVIVFPPGLSKNRV